MDRRAGEARREAAVEPLPCRVLAQLARRGHEAVLVEDAPVLDPQREDHPVAVEPVPVPRPVHVVPRGADAVERALDLGGKRALDLELAREGSRLLLEALETELPAGAISGGSGLPGFGVERLALVGLHHGGSLSWYSPKWTVTIHFDRPQ